MLNMAIQNNGDPKAFLQQVMNGATPEQREGLIKQAKQYGCPEHVLSLIQNMK